MRSENPRPQRVLIVEDNVDTARTLTFLLRHSGYLVEYAINGYAALAIAEQWRPDVVFLDLGLPDFDGCALLRRMRRLPHLESTRFIAISGRVSDDDEERAISHGCERFVRKPVTPRVIEEILAGPAPLPGARPVRTVPSKA